MTQADRLDATFTALADATRRAILARLALGEASVAELAEPFAISQPAISKHLKILERAQLISVGQDRQRRPRRLVAKPLAEANAWLERYRDLWEASFERLDALLAELQQPQGPQPQPQPQAQGRAQAQPRQPPARQAPQAQPNKGAGKAGRVRPRRAKKTARRR